jgi:hypothetical protein
VSPTPPAERPRPGVFDGKVGFARALLYGLAAGSLTAGTTMAAAAVGRGNAAQQVLETLVQKGGAGPCYRTAPGSGQSCREIVQLAQEHDDYTHAAIGLIAVAGALGTAASIWIVQTPPTLAVRVKPTAAGSPAGVTLEGLW